MELHDSNDDQRFPHAPPATLGPVSSPLAAPLSTGTCATLACLLEVTAAKPGNVYRGADFEEMTYADMIVSAAVIGPVMEEAVDCRVGQTILQAVRATQAAVAQNTNLGTVLLLAPLAKVPHDTPLPAGIGPVLADLDQQDAADAYGAIRAAHPGGLGSVAQADVHDDPKISLRDAMALAADRDLVASQYVNGYREVLDQALPLLVAGQRHGWPLSQTIVYTQLQLMAELPDSLIARKCGLDVAREASARAAAVLAAGTPGDTGYNRAIADLDFWLRADRNRRNPGTTADLLAAALFVALRDGLIEWPLRYYAPLRQ